MNDNWCTPRNVVDVLYEFNEGKPPALDPCSNINSIVGAIIEFWGPPNGHDGLLYQWPLEEEGLVYANPPYSQLDVWSRKFHEQAQRGVELISLVPAYTDTAWFHQYHVPGKVRLFWRGRMKFGIPGRKSTTARFPSLLTYWGSRVDRFVEVFGGRGYLCR